MEGFPSHFSLRKMGRGQLLLYEQENRCSLTLPRDLSTSRYFMSSRPNQFVNEMIHTT